MKGDRTSGKLSHLRQLVMLSLLVAVSGGLSVLAASVLPMSAAVAQTTDARKAEGDRLLEQGKRHYQTRQYRAALQSWQRALEIYRATRGQEDEARVLMYLGDAYDSLHQYNKAIESFQQALPIYRAVGNRRGEAGVLMNLGLAYDSLSDHGKAIEFYQQALSLHRRVQNRNGEANTLGNLGNAYHFLSQYSKAIEFYQQALSLHRQVQNRNGEASALTSLGNAHNLLSQYSKAIEYYQQALPIFRQVQNHNKEAKVLNNLGSVYFSLSQHGKAIEYHQQALSLHRQVQDRNGEASALMNLGNVYDSLSQPRKAIKYYEQALSVSRQVQNRNREAKALGSLGIAYYSLSQPKKAIEYYEQALPIFHQVQDQVGEASTLNILGLAYSSLSQYGKAIEYYQQALPIFRQVNDRDGEAKTLNNLGLTYFKTNQFIQAEQDLRQAIAIKETIRLDRLSDANKISLFEEQERTYRTLQQVLIAQKQSEAALSISEWGRAKALVELLAARSTGDMKTATSPQRSAAPSIQQIRQVAQSQNATLVQYSIIYDQVNQPGEDQERFPASRLYIWVIKPTGEITFRNVDLKSLLQQQALWELVLISRGAIGVRGLPDRASLKIPPDVIARIQQAQAAQTKSNLQRLHQILISPIADLLPQDPNQHVIFMPQAELYLVPFAALQDPNGKYLIEQHTLLTAPSIQTLALTQQQKARLNHPTQFTNALVVGNPTMPKLTDGTLPPLPGAAQEAEAIAPLLRTKSLTGNQATKAAIVRQMPQASIIHLATHGLVDTNNGFGSAIALAPDRPGTPNDGLLTAEEIFPMKLKAELVVLRACDTGRGRITGDGVVGLSRSLITAGVPSVMVSLWSIPDAPTAALMTNFYQNWQTRRMDKAQALRQAMLNTLKTHPQPKDWAAFTLIGEAQ